MREEWYVVPARYALSLREEDEDPHLAGLQAGDDVLLDGMHADIFDTVDTIDTIDTIDTDIDTDSGPLDPPPPRHLPRKSSGHLKR